MHPNAYNEMRKFRDKYLDPDIAYRLLDVGSQDVNGNQRSLFPKCYYKGLDISAGKNVDVVADDPYQWPIKDEICDVVISNQTLEHVEFPWLTMQEISRVLAPGGLCCVISPSNGPEHRYPKDCYRYMPDGLKALARSANIECLEAYRSETPHRNLQIFREWVGKRPLNSIWIDCVFIGRKQ